MRSRRPKTWRTCLHGFALYLPLCMLPQLAWAERPSLQLSAGVDYSRGDFGGTQNVQAIVEPFTAKVLWKNWTFRATLPVAAVQAPFVVTTITQLPPPPHSGLPTTITTISQVVKWESGLADMSLSTTYTFNRLFGTPFYFDVIGRARLPTGDVTKGLGLGVYDYVAAGELGGDWVRGGVSVGFGRRFLGSTAQLNRLDGWQGSAGAWLNANHRLQIGTFLDWHDASFVDTAPYRLAGGYLAYRLNSELKLQVYSGGGLSTSSPKVNAGFTIIYRPRRREH